MIIQLVEGRLRAIVIPMKSNQSLNVDVTEQAVIQIRIRLDLHFFYLLDLDPDPGTQNLSTF